MAPIATGVVGSRNAAALFERYVFGIGMERNVGGVERTARYTLSAILSGLGIIGSPSQSSTAG